MNSTVRYIADRFLKNYKNSGGTHIRANCPFCGSTTGFVMDKSNGLFICFSCQQKGGLPQFMSKMGCSRTEISSVVDNMPRVRKKQDFSSYTILPEYVLGAYDWCPNTMLTLGYSPQFLKDNDVGYDRIQQRITFPIRDELGNLVAISGRADTPNAFPRYKVYSDEFSHIAENYKPKNRHFLYNMHAIGPETEKPLYLVEGYKACLWMKMHGHDVVALQGSGITKPQLQKIISIRRTIRIFLDNEYGKQLPPQTKEVIHAAIDIGSKIEPYNEVEIVIYPEGSELRTAPDDLAGDELNNLKCIKLNLYKIRKKLCSETTRSVQAR